MLFFFFFNDTATTEIYTLSLHDALPISLRCRTPRAHGRRTTTVAPRPSRRQDRKSTRLNSSHVRISYAVFCLKKKKKPNNLIRILLCPVLLPVKFINSIIVIQKPLTHEI